MSDDVNRIPASMARRWRYEVESRDALIAKLECDAKRLTAMYDEMRSALQGYWDLADEMGVGNNNRERLRGEDLGRPLSYAIRRRFKQLEAQRDSLAEALEVLDKRIRVAIFPSQVREAVGDTNWKGLWDAIEEADRTLAELEEQR